MARPGMMLYFDILEPIKVLPDADKGRLLVAMLEYGQSGTVPEFDGILALAWGFVKPGIDKDAETYNRIVLKRQYANYCKDQKKKGEPEISFDEWVKTVDDQSYQMISHDATWNHMEPHGTTWHPTTTTTPSTTTNSTTTTATAAAATTNTTGMAAATEEDMVRVIGGELGKNVVFLADKQISDLLDKMDIETFDYYVDKLAAFIIKNDAHVKNHYETILKWWKEDSAVPKTETVPNGAFGILGKAELEAIQRNMGEE